MATEALGTVWLDEQALPIESIRLRGGEIVVTAGVPRGMTIHKGHNEYRVHGPDGSFIYATELDFDATLSAVGWTRVHLSLPLSIAEVTKSNGTAHVPRDLR